MAIASIRGKAITAFTIGGTDLKESIGPGNLIVRWGPDLVADTHGGDIGARWSRYAPPDIQLDVPINPADENLSALLLVSATKGYDNDAFSNADDQSVAIAVTNATGKKGLNIAGNIIIGQVEMTLNPGTGDGGYTLPLRQVGTPLAVTAPAASQEDTDE